MKTGSQTLSKSTTIYISWSQATNTSYIGSQSGPHQSHEQERPGANMPHMQVTLQDKTFWRQLRGEKIS